MLGYVYHVLDLALMPLYRFPDSTVAGYYLGTFVLACAGMIIGEYSIALAFRLNRKMIERDNSRINHFQDLSFEALKAGNKSAFRACNGIANETYGKSFFTQITLSAASLWPLFIALGWMQHRFAEVEFHLPFSIPLIGGTAGYVSTFLFCYISARIIKKKLGNLMIHLKSPVKQEK